MSDIWEHIEKSQKRLIRDVMPGQPDNERRDKMLSVIAASLVMIAEQLQILCEQKRQGD